MTSMFNAMTGLLSHQFKMDVIGNNMANVNTTGYKGSQTIIEDTFNEEQRLATTSVPTSLGIGLGSQVVATAVQFTQGAFQRTDVPTDVGISGDGFFLLGKTSSSSAPDYFTRAGGFSLDSSNYLRTPDGDYVLGNNGDTFSDENVPIQIPTTVNGENLASFSIGTDGAITSTGDAGSLAVTNYIHLATFANEEGLTPDAGTKFIESSGSGAYSTEQPGSGRAGKTQTGVLELSNVDLAASFTDMIMTQRGFDVNAKVITTSDEMLQIANNLKR